MTIGDALFGAFAIPFMSRALLVMLVLAVVAGVVGVLVNLRGLEFISDGLTHAVFPGLAIGLAVAGTAGLLPGAAIAALAGAVVLTLLARAGIASDAAIAIVLTATFSVGVIVVSRSDDYAGELEALLFGRVLTIPPEEVLPLVAVSLVALVAVVVTLKQQLFRAFDARGSRAAGDSALVLDLVLNASVALVVVAAASTDRHAPRARAPHRARRRLAARHRAPLVALPRGRALRRARARGSGSQPDSPMSVGAGVELPAGATVVAVFVVGYGLVLLVHRLLGRRTAAAGRGEHAAGSGAGADSVSASLAASAGEGR